jgi:hypothetical protein
MVKNQPSARQCVLLFLFAIQDAEKRLNRSVQRVRLPRGTLRRLWMRERLSDQFLQDVGTWLLSVGWALIDAGATFGAVRTRGMKDWPRVSTKTLDPTLQMVKLGEQLAAKEFEELERNLSSLIERYEDEDED